MEPSQMFGYMITAMGVLAGVIGFLGRWIIGDVKQLKKNHAALEEKLENEIHKRQESDLKALRSEIEAKMPCHLPDCPKRATFSLEVCPAVSATSSR